MTYLLSLYYQCNLKALLNFRVSNIQCIFLKGKLYGNKSFKKALQIKTAQYYLWTDMPMYSCTLHRLKSYIYIYLLYQYL